MTSFLSLFLATNPVSHSYKGYTIYTDAPVASNNNGVMSRVDIYKGEEYIKCFLYKGAQGEERAIEKCEAYIDNLPDS